MHLRDYMKERKLTPAAMAAQIGRVSEGHVKKLMYGERQPSLPVALRIEEITEGEVKAEEMLKPARAEAAE